MTEKNFKISTVATTPFDGQIPGTSGLRKKVKVFQQPQYTENYIQATLLSMDNKLKDCHLAVGGDGRFYSKKVIDIIMKICAANEVKKLTVGQNGHMSTPAMSCLIRSLKCDGGFVITASHNPGGPHEDFGIKFNSSNGGPANVTITNNIASICKSISEYYICPNLTCKVSKIGVQTFKIEGIRSFIVEVIDPVDNYVSIMKDMFDFKLIKNHLNSGIGILIDCMNGITSLYARRIFLHEFGCSPNSIVNSELKEDFGGRHPDPNLTYALDLVATLKMNDSIKFAAAFDADGDRYMVLGPLGVFVTPSDSLAILAANLKYINYFNKTEIKGFARSMPTSSAIDRVAKQLNIPLFETPTGWKFFGNLFDANKLTLCGEECFSIGSDYCREKDGIWAILAWLSIIANTRKNIDEILYNHWKSFGRDFNIRYDYENCDSKKCLEMMTIVENKILQPTFIGKNLGTRDQPFVVVKADNFEYIDPIDDTVSHNQGIRIIFENDSKIVLRLSGTSSHGSTVRLYINSYDKRDSIIRLKAERVLKPLIEIALKFCQIKEFTERSHPTVIT